MGKAKEIFLSLGLSRRIAEEYEFKLKEADCLKEEEEKKEKLGVKTRIKTREISEILSEGEVKEDGLIST